MPTPPVPRPSTAIPDRLLYPVKEARKLWGGMAHSTFYKLVSQKKIELVYIGRRAYVPEREVQRIARDGVPGR